mgnify:CR=1 FL=1
MGRKNKTYRLSLHQQVYNRLTDMQAFGESKQLAKTDGSMQGKKYSVIVPTRVLQGLSVLCKNISTRIIQK